MFRLLLATDKPEVIAACRAQNWNLIGFKEPRIAGSVEEALQLLQKHHIDAVTFDLPRDQSEVLTKVLMNDYPSMPVIRAGHTPEEAQRQAAELSSLLNRLSEDFSNDDFTREDKLRQCRHEFFRALLGGKCHDRREVDSRLMMLRSKMDPSQPCFVMSLSLPNGDNFLSDRWRYGSDRLEVALRNFLGAELEGMRILVSVLPDEEIYLLACPMRQSRVDIHAVEPILQKHTSDSLDHIRDYLGLSLLIEEVVILPSVLDLTVPEA